LHEDRFDTRLVLHSAAALPDVSFVLAGPVLLGQQSRDRLSQTPNIHVLGVVEHAMIPSLLHAFDVCILPMPVSEFTDSLDPIKIREYLAAGRPVVSTRFDAVTAYQQLLTVTSGEGFAAGVAEAIRTAPQHDGGPGRLALAGQRWTDRVDAAAAVLTRARSHAAGA
ncbi:MAG: glycosyltransferase, partial [Actinomycetota bacterium]|nr:glycosyltransferase [Actinomycetota bacterium]